MLTIVPPVQQESGKIWDSDKAFGIVTLKKDSMCTCSSHCIFTGWGHTVRVRQRQLFMKYKLVICHRQQCSLRCHWNMPARHGRRLSVTAANLLKFKWELISFFNCFSLSLPSSNTCQMFPPHLLFLVLLKTSAGKMWTVFWPCLHANHPGYKWWS